MPQSRSIVKPKRWLSREVVIRLLHEEGSSLGKIADKLNVSRPHVSMVLARRVTSGRVKREIEKTIGRAVEV
jgi:DNA-binding transcriptional regulator LsrR (DeoR family)